MRIISGKWGGRRLVAFTSDAIRPTTDRVKETIFNMIGPDIVEAKVLDLFAGTGNLSLEAASRGALQVVAVDSGTDSKEVFEKNRALVGAGSELTYKSQDIFKYLERVDEAFDVVLIDPPFTEKMGASVLRALEASKALHEDTRVFIECVKGEDTIDEDHGCLLVDKIKKYGDKSLYTYRVQKKQDEE